MEGNVFKLPNDLFIWLSGSGYQMRYKEYFPFEDQLKGARSPLQQVMKNFCLSLNEEAVIFLKKDYEEHLSRLIDKMEKTEERVMNAGGLEKVKGLEWLRDDLIDICHYKDKIDGFRWATLSLKSHRWHKDLIKTIEEIGAVIGVNLKLHTTIPGMHPREAEGLGLAPKYWEATT